MIRFFDIVREFEKTEHEFEKMVCNVGHNYEKLVLHMDKIYCPIKGGRVFEVKHIIVPTVIEFEPIIDFKISRSLKEALKARRAENYIGVDRKHQILILKLPGMENELVTRLVKIETEQIPVTNFDKKVGY